MTPAGLLMKEHRVIERMIEQIDSRMRRMGERGELDLSFVDTAVDFIRVYADMTHHGKEEDILFRALKDKPLSDEHRRAMDELIEEHEYGRSVTRQLVEIRRTTPRSGEMLGTVVFQLNKLVQFYPRHITREDKEFFPAAMSYLADDEKEGMLRRFDEFDKTMIHRKYRAVVEELREQ